MTDQEIIHAAWDADAAWSAELQKCFGKRAGDVRYTKEGQGELGSDLNRAYLVCTAASAAHTALWDRILGRVRRAG